MAEEPEAPKVDPELPEETLQPGDEGSLADILAKDREERIAAHTGIQVSEDEPEVPESPEAPETPEVKATEEETPESPKFEPKHKTWEETEKARKEAERLITERSEAAKQDREAREAAERERDELRQKLAEKEAAAASEKPAEPVKTPDEVEAEQEAKIEQALDEIDKIDEFDPDYKKKVAKAWRKAGIGGAGQPAIPAKEEIAKLVQEQIKAEREAETQAKAEEAKATEETNVRTRAGELAGKAGLNMEEGTADNKLFWATVNDMPKEFDDKPFEEQVQWTVNEVRRLKGEVVQSKEERDRLARAAQANNTVMGRGTTQPKKAPEPETFTLGGTMNEILEERRQASRARR
jgi:hypothetical protein